MYDNLCEGIGSKGAHLHRALKRRSSLSFFCVGFALVMGELPKERKKMSRPDLEKTEEKREKTAKSSKAKEPKQPEPKSAQFPAEGKLNKYGFVYLNDDILNPWLGHGKGTEQKISIDLKEGNLIVSKA